MPVPFASNQ